MTIQQRTIALKQALERLDAQKRRRKVFVSYHHADQDEVNDFINTFDRKHDVFICRALGVIPRDIVDSNDTNYVMKRIRQSYLADSTVTLVLIGKCTWTRRYIDWEIQASLRSGEVVIPNGLLGIVLPSVNQRNLQLPPRLDANIQGKNGNEGYARCYWYPNRKDALAKWIEDAFQARITRAHLIVNRRDRFKYNKICS